ncbi:MAG TPA: FtsX-like permease family protein [Streptosporangiaceae bacterium]|jgi:putative ABC transport system permease protein
MTGMRGLRRELAAVVGTGAVAAAAFGLLTAIVVFAAVAGPRQSLQGRTAALQHIFAATPPATRSVQAAADLQQAQDQTGQALSGSELTEVSGQLAAQLSDLRLPLAGPASAWYGASSAYNPVSGVARSAQAGAPPEMEVLYRGSLAANARLVAGHYPGQQDASQQDASQQDASRPGAGGGPRLGVVVTTGTASRFGLRPGHRVTLSLPSGPVRVVVTGIIQPVHPGTTFWTLDPDAAAPSLNLPQNKVTGLPYWIGAAFAGPGEFGTLVSVFGSQDMRLQWDFPLALRGVTADQAQTLQNRLNRALTQAGVGLPGSLLNAFGPVVTSGLTESLAAFIATQNALQPVLSLLFISLTVTGAVTAWLAAMMLAERRDAEFTTMRARGASLRQLAALMLRGSALVIVPAAVLGAGIAVALTPRGGIALAWWLAGATLLAALGGPAAIVVYRQRKVGPARAADDPAAARQIPARRWVTEVSLAVICVAGLVVLRQQGNSQAGGVNFYTGAGPVLAAIPAALIVLRLCPLLLRGLLRLAAQRAGAAWFIGLAAAARAGLSAVLPAFALVLALAVAAFGGMISSAVSRGQVAASWQSTGADAVVDASQIAAGIPGAAQRRIAAVPGARHAAATYVSEVTLDSGAGVTVAAVDPARYAALVAATPWPAVPPGLPERPPAGWTVRQPVPVIASPAAAAALGHRGVSVAIGNGQLTFRVAGIVHSTPALPGTGSFVLVPLWAVQRTPFPPAPTIMLLTGPHLDTHALTAAVSRALPGAELTFRSVVLAGLANAPLQHTAGTLFGEGVGLAAGLAAVILLLGLAMGARTRAYALARLRVLGFGRQQSRLLLAAQTLPQVVAAVLAGLACAWLLGPLIGPDLDLSVFTGSPASVPISPDYLSLGLPAALLLILAAATLTVQASRASRPGPRTATALRTEG